MICKSPRVQVNCKTCGKPVSVTKRMLPAFKGNCRACKIKTWTANQKAKYVSIGYSSKKGILKEEPTTEKVYYKIYAKAYNVSEDQAKEICENFPKRATTISWTEFTNKLFGRLT